MPQGRRKVPYSGKSKNQQPQTKRDKKAVLSCVEETHSDEPGPSRVVKINAQPSQSAKAKSSRFALMFLQETDEEIRRKKEAAHCVLEPCQEYLEVGDTYYVKEVQFPKRPLWSFSLTPHELEVNEQKCFEEYILHLEKNAPGISYFDFNIETWRQLWRVMEKSDVILCIVDVRFPSLMFPPSLYEYVTRVLQKHIVLVLNKVDLVPPYVVIAWQVYFNLKYDLLHILYFSSLPDYNLQKPTKESKLKRYLKKGKMKMAVEGAQALYDICEKIVQNKVDLRFWQKRINSHVNKCYSDEELEDEDENEIEIEIDIDKDKDKDKEERNFKEVCALSPRPPLFQNGILTIGCVGYPNSGKSSVMNALFGRKVVSVSKTPGHTKHFQTMFLTPNVLFCDCPGLVFPAFVPKNLQVLMGSFPIAQLKEPYSAIRFLAEHMDLPQHLSLQHPDGVGIWTPYDICIAWALKKDFLTARVARPDTYRAANQILRMFLEGRINMWTYPPGYSKCKDFWENHHDIPLVMRVRGKSDPKTSFVPGTSLKEEDEDSDEDSDKNMYEDLEKDPDNSVDLGGSSQSSQYHS